MNTRHIPKTHDELIQLGRVALGAAEALADEIGLEQNTPARIRADVQAVVRLSVDDPSTTTQQALNEARVAIDEIRATRRQAMADGRRFCAMAIDLLKMHFGRRWNAKWIPTGFSNRSLAIPYDPLARLIDLRNHFRSCPEHEYAALNLTAARADELATALTETTSDVLAKGVTRHSARKSRDAALQQLAVRLRGLRCELDQLLSRDDLRWRRFGFSRPIDRRQPAQIEAVTLEPELPGVVQASWPPSARAENYRVRWTEEGSVEPEHELDLVAVPVLRLTDLPSGVAIVVSITARNRTGESLPTSERVVVP